MAWNDITAITDLKVQLKDGTDLANIYANGRHQIGIVIYVTGCKEVKTESSSQCVPVPITPEEVIQNTSLIDYVTGEKLNYKKDESWNYTDIENKYHTESVNRVTKGTNALFYVQYNPSSGGLVNKSIAVKATLTNDSTTKKEYSTAENSDFDSKVIVRALQKKIYIMDDMGFDQNYDHKGEDKFYYEGCGANLNKEISWKQNNYFFYINDQKQHGFFIKNVDVSGYNSNEQKYQVGKYAIYSRFPTCGWFCLENVFNVGFVWPMSKENKKETVTLNTRVRNISADIEVNQRTNSLCLTRMKYTDESQVFGDNCNFSKYIIDEHNRNLTWGANITIYDQYGNEGKFHASQDDDGDKIQIFNYHSLRVSMPYQSRSFAIAENLVSRYISDISSSLSKDSLFWKLWNNSRDIAQKILSSEYFKGIKEGNLDPNSYGVLLLQEAAYFFYAKDYFRTMADFEDDPKIRKFLLLKEKAYFNYCDKLFTKNWKIKRPDSLIIHSHVNDYITHGKNTVIYENSFYLLIAMLPYEYLCHWLACELKRDTKPESLYYFWVEKNINEPTGAYQIGNLLEKYRKDIDEEKAELIYKSSMHFAYTLFNSPV